MIINKKDRDFMRDNFTRAQRSRIISIDKREAFIQGMLAVSKVCYTEADVTKFVDDVVNNQDQFRREAGLEVDWEIKVLALAFAISQMFDPEKVNDDLHRLCALTKCGKYVLKEMSQ